MSDKKNVNVIVVEDNKIFNSILTRALNEHLSSTPQFTSNYNIKLYSFLTSEDCLSALYEDRFSGTSIAFLDYYLGNNTNGIQILNCFREKNKNIKFVVLSQSNIIEKQLSTEGQLDSNSYFLRKDIYAPDICCLLMEDFMQNHT